MAVSRLGQRRQVVIPKEICAELGLEQGDFVKVGVTEGAAIVKPKKLVDTDDILTPDEEMLVRKGEAQLRRGQYITLEQLEHDVERQARKRSPKAV